MFRNLKSNDGEVWINLQQNIIDSDVNEQKKHLHACVHTVGQHFEQFYCRQLKTMCQPKC